MADPPIAMAGAIVEKRPRTVNSRGRSVVYSADTPAGGGSMNISVIGTGFVGFVKGACFVEVVVYLTCLDKDARLIRHISNDAIHLYHTGLSETFRQGPTSGKL